MATWSLTVICASCVNTIRETLSALSPRPAAIHTSIVAQTVSVEHSPDLPPASIKDALDDAGFDLVSTPDHEQFMLRASGRRASNLPDLIRRKKEKHAEQCLLCQQEQGHHDGAADHATIADLSEHSKAPSVSETLVHPSPSHAAKTGLPPDEAESSSTSPPYDEGPLNVAFSVGGMTCASCVGNVRNSASEIPGVSNVVVNLVGKSATATIERRALIERIVDAIEDGGYEAEFISAEPASKPKPKPVAKPKVAQEDSGPFLATFSVGGMTCASCVGNVTRAAAEVSGVSDVSVSLVGKSATAVLDKRELSKAVVEAIEDAGYEVNVVSVEPVKLSQSDEEQATERTVSLRVDGMFCQ